MTIGEKIKYYREINDLTQDDVAKFLNVSPQNIYKYEKGIITNIPLDKIALMADLFNISPNDLTEWKTKEKPAPKNGDELSEAISIFSSLTPANRDKLLELARLYLNDQNKNEDTQ